MAGFCWFHRLHVAGDAFALNSVDQTDSIFHLLNWSVFSTFSGKHEANLYKLCKDYVGVRRTPQFTMEKFREYMGIGAREYPEFKALNRYVIADPIKRINESSISDKSSIPAVSRPA